MSSGSQKQAAKRKNGIDENDSSPEDCNYEPPRKQTITQGSHIKRHFDPALKDHRVWDGWLSRFVRSYTRWKQVTQLFCKSENFECHKIGIDKKGNFKIVIHANPHHNIQANSRPVIKREFNSGDIVSVDGRHLNIPELANISNPPIFYGTIEDFFRYNPEKARDIKDHQSYVHVVLSGNVEWKDNNTMNW